MMRNVWNQTKFWNRWFKETVTIMSWKSCHVRIRRRPWPNISVTTGPTSSSTNYWRCWRQFFFFYSKLVLLLRLKVTTKPGHICGCAKHSTSFFFGPRILDKSATWSLYALKHFLALLSCDLDFFLRLITSGLLSSSAFAISFSALKIKIISCK